MKYLKINRKTVMHVNSQYWLYEDIKRYFKNYPLDFYLLEMDGRTYCFIKAKYPEKNLEMLLMGKSTNMFSYSDYLIVKIDNGKGLENLSEKEYMFKIISKGIDFEKYEIDSFTRWYSWAEEKGGMKILDLTELERIFALEYAKLKN